MASPEPPWLLSDNAAAAIAAASGDLAGPAAIASLRRAIGGPDATQRAAEVAELIDLRRRGAKKFAHAERMFFTRKALEQATDQWVAAYKASRFERSTRVVDACCGIGGDLIAMGEVAAWAVGVDADPALAAYAARNAAACGVEARTECVLLDEDNLPECDAWHADPDRRPSGRRTTQPDAHEPSLATLDAWRARTPAAAVKLAPAARLPEAWQRECELEWISRGGECRQLVAWCGPLTTEPGRRRATRVGPDGAAVSCVGEAGVGTALAESLGAYVHDLDPAVLAADLSGAVAEQHGLLRASPKVAYLTSDTRAEHGLIASFEVVEVLPLKRKRLAAWLAERGVGTLEIKCRGVDLRPETLRKELKPKGDQPATLLVFPDAGGKPQVVIARRVGG